eukprot:148443-Karenia_brevis.AAC.1
MVAPDRADASAICPDCFAFYYDLLSEIAGGLPVPHLTQGAAKEKYVPSRVAGNEAVRTRRNPRTKKISRRLPVNTASTGPCWDRET